MKKQNKQQYERKSINKEFQIRHRKFGIFQAQVPEIGILFFPQSEMPEYGIYRFKSVDDAEGVIAYLESIGLKKRDMSIEAWDDKLNSRLLSLAQKIIIAEKNAQFHGIYGRA